MKTKSEKLGMVLLYFGILVAYLIWLVYFLWFSGNYRILSEMIKERLSAFGIDLIIPSLLLIKILFDNWLGIILIIMGLLVIFTYSTIIKNNRLKRKILGEGNGRNK